MPEMLIDLLRRWTNLLPCALQLLDFFFRVFEILGISQRLSRRAQCFLACGIVPALPVQFFKMCGSPMEEDIAGRAEALPECLFILADAANLLPS
jgi:hypothetical protein